MISPTTEKYLRLYAEEEVGNFVEASSTLDIAACQYCLVIPTFQERYESLKDVWQNLSPEFLAIICANSPNDNEPITRQLMTDLRAKAQIVRCHNEFSYLEMDNGHKILLIDRCSRSIPKKQGVGLARKIGADIALKLIQLQLIEHSIIFNTDADAVLPPDYFQSVTKVVTDQTAAIIFPFRHGPNQTNRIACDLYELSLLYYVGGLKYANSPYAHQTVGSTISINSEHYTKVRGFPCRSAGEDFYLLNKLAKTGTILSLAEPEILLSSRLSNRVSFGTGIGIQNILALGSASEYQFYHPHIFVLLKQLLSELATYQESAESNGAQHEPFTSPEVRHWTEISGLMKTIQTKQHLQKPVFQKFIHDWMDGFRTLKFIHFMRDRYFSSVPIEEISKAPFLKQLKSSPKISQIRETLISMV